MLDANLCRSQIDLSEGAVINVQSTGNTGTTTTGLIDHSISGNSAIVTGTPSYNTDKNYVSTSAGLKMDTSDMIEGSGSFPYEPNDKHLNIS